MPSAKETASQSPVASFEILNDSADLLELKISGSLNAGGVAELWTPTTQKIAQAGKNIRVDASAVNLCDSTGAVFLRDLQRLAVSGGHQFQIDNLRPEFAKTLEIFPIDSIVPKKNGVRRSPNLVITVGEATWNLIEDLRNQIIFLGQLSAALYHVMLHPRQLHVKKILQIFQAAAVEGLPIVGLISLLTGLIIASQSVGPLRTYGADIHVIYLVSLIMFRELGPIMTAILLAGRTGSAFAAEIGTMKVNEELDALKTMGLDPVRFLVVERVIAGFWAMPFLTIYSMLLGSGAAFIVMLGNGYSLSALYVELTTYCNVTDVMEGMLKSFFFGVLVTGVGCLRGIQTRAGASSVGISTTRAVVSSIILIIASDCIFTFISTTLRATTVSMP
ncbi:MAG: ABC transporter permease [Verrucomicrobiales bacterium]|jgi:phospholipid/cholesterol/gamma-HCH transport system permease protein|nr:ABC transporter permease [Verrucomicrobiales bacterium]